jgi:hypothetical protein
MTDFIRKPVQMIGFGVIGAGNGFIIGTSFGLSILLVNDSIGFILSGGQSDPVEYKPLKANEAQAVMLAGIIGPLIVGGIVGATFGAII